MKITIIFEIVNTNAFDWHFIFFMSPFQTHCFQNFNSYFHIKLVKLTTPGVKPLLVLINITHQKLSYLHWKERLTSEILSYQSISFYQSYSAMIHVDSFVYIRMLSLKIVLGKEIFVEFMWNLFWQISCKFKTRKFLKCCCFS